MDFKIAVLAGDGIGPEISVQGVDVMNAVCEKFGHKVSYEYAICGADAIDKVGDPFPEATFQACKNADAVLFSAVGDPKFDNDPTAKVRPEQGLLAMRKKLGLYANIRPVSTFPSLIHKSPLRADLVDGAPQGGLVGSFIKYSPCHRINRQQGGHIIPPRGELLLKGTRQSIYIDMTVAIPLRHPGERVIHESD